VQNRRRFSRGMVVSSVGAVPVMRVPRVLLGHVRLTGPS
jgi:hypothetical protein